MTRRFIVFISTLILYSTMYAAFDIHMSFDKDIMNNFVYRSTYKDAVEHALTAWQYMDLFEADVTQQDEEKIDLLIGKVVRLYCFFNQADERIYTKIMDDRAFWSHVIQTILSKVIQASFLGCCSAYLQEILNSLLLLIKEDKMPQMLALHHKKVFIAKK